MNNELRNFFINNIEEEYDVEIIFACESGSRCFGNK